MEWKKCEFSESDKSLRHELKSIKRSCLSHMSCWPYSSILVSNTKEWRVKTLFAVVTNIFVIDFSELNVSIKWKRNC